MPDSGPRSPGSILKELLVLLGVPPKAVPGCTERNVQRLLGPDAQRPHSATRDLMERFLQEQIRSVPEEEQHRGQDLFDELRSAWDRRRGADAEIEVPAETAESLRADPPNPAIDGGGSRHEGGLPTVSPTERIFEARSELWRGDEELAALRIKRRYRGDLFDDFSEKLERVVKSLRQIPEFALLDAEITVLTALADQIETQRGSLPRPRGDDSEAGIARIHDLIRQALATTISVDRRMSTFPPPNCLREGVRGMLPRSVLLFVGLREGDPTDGSRRELVWQHLMALAAPWATAVGYRSTSRVLAFWRQDGRLDLGALCAFGCAREMLHRVETLRRLGEVGRAQLGVRLAIGVDEVDHCGNGDVQGLRDLREILRLLPDAADAKLTNPEDGIFFFRDAYASLPDFIQRAVEKAADGVYRARFPFVPVEAEDGERKHAKSVPPRAGASEPARQRRTR